MGGDLGPAPSNAQQFQKSSSVAAEDGGKERGCSAEQEELEKAIEEELLKVGEEGNDAASKRKADGGEADEFDLL